MRKWLAVACVLFLTACGTFGGSSSGGKSHGGDSYKTSNGDLIGAGMSKTQPDRVMQRRIVLHFAHSNEGLDIVYFHDGHYDQKALHAINHLLRDRRAGVVGPIDPELIDFLVDIRARLSLPPSVTFEILSGYRTRQSNNLLARHNGNVASESLHMHGWAVDFRIPNMDGAAVAAIAKTMQRGAAVYYPKSNHIHVDIGNIRNWHER